MKSSNTCSTANGKGLKPHKPIFKTPGKTYAKSKGVNLSSAAQPCTVTGPVQSPVISGKIKLQLFPIDGPIKSTLEQNNHNPYLELTLTIQKKISSVVKHLTEKWRDSLDFSTGEILLFPYNARPDNLTSVNRWSLRDKYITAADVYFMLNSPSVFRLRYGWFLKQESATNDRPPPHHVESSQSRQNLTEVNKPAQLRALNRENDSSNFTSSLNNTAQTHQDNNNALNPKPTPAVSWLDGLSNMSFGALLEGINPISQMKNVNSITTDSFDADIGALIARQQQQQQPTNQHEATQMATQKVANENNSNNPSIWDAEVACDAFSVQTQVPADLLSANRVETNNKEKENESMMPPKEESNLLGKLDFSWAESIGPFENAIPNSRPTSVGTTDSTAAFSGLMSSSLDAFQKFLHF
ncbi:hypothetical protein LUZ60_009622 [Juncus effusus]|nr:hypothetical protein LUZ60_009622 [Juncus effusus]